MKIAIIGGGAAGMVTAHYTDKHFDVTVFERQAMLGGNVRTLNKNVPRPGEKIPADLFIDNGVIEFDESNFVLFHSLMRELGVEMEQVSLTTGYFGLDGRYFLSPYRIFASEPSPRGRIREVMKLGFCVFDFQSFMLRTGLHGEDFYKDKCITDCFRDHVYYRWLKMLLMYAYSIPYAQVDAMPAALGIPVLRRCALFTRWTRIKGGVFTYMEKILERFGGTIRLGVEIAGIQRTRDHVEITTADGGAERFDRVVFATPPDQVLKLLSDPSPEEIRHFSGWRENVAHTVIHTDPSMYAPYRISSFSAFDVFEKEHGDAGYNGFLNPLLGLPESAPIKYNLAFNMDDQISPDRVLHTQEHRTPLYEVNAYASRDAIIESNGRNHTYHAGAYLYDGLHEGAVQSALAVSTLLKESVGQFAGET